jgi:hypothetical protein
MERRGGDEQEQEDFAKKLIIKGNKMVLSLTFTVWSVLVLKEMAYSVNHALPSHVCL